MNTTTANASDMDWANEQFEGIEASKSAARAFDASEDGARYLGITGVTMWENLGGDSLPE